MSHVISNGTYLKRKTGDASIIKLCLLVFFCQKKLGGTEGRRVSVRGLLHPLTEFTRLKILWMGSNEYNNNIACIDFGYKFFLIGGSNFLAFSITAEKRANRPTFSKKQQISVE